MKKIIGLSLVGICGIALLGSCTNVKDSSNKVKQTNSSVVNTAEETKSINSKKSVFDKSNPPKTNNEELDNEIKEFGLQYDELTDRANNFAKAPESFTQEKQLEFLQDQQTAITTMTSVIQKLTDLEEQKKINTATYLKVNNYIQNKNSKLLSAISKLPEDFKLETAENGQSVNTNTIEATMESIPKDKKDNNTESYSNNEQTKNNNLINPTHSQWATSYSFYYPRGEQKQSGLTIDTNGNVTQTNSDGSSFTGQASISDTSGSILSYDVSGYDPNQMEKPSTKQINPNVQITVDWDNNGGTDIYYGYISYTQKLVLTDGIPVTDGVKEVWISF